MSLVFKWGSLVGLSLPSSGATGSFPFVVGNVVFKPREFTGTITNDWATVPWCKTDFAPYGNTAIDHLKQTHTVANIKIGIGDICRYMGGGWRIPTAAEWAELYGSDQIDGGQAVKLGNGWIEGNYYPLSGRAMGPHQTNVAIAGSGTDAQITGADPNTDGALFLPTCGYRSFAHGEINRMGVGGFYWSSTANTTTQCFSFGLESSTVYPQTNAFRADGFPIRCIRE